jgi:rubredoxin
MLERLWVIECDADGHDPQCDGRAGRIEIDGDATRQMVIGTLTLRGWERIAKRLICPDCKVRRIAEAQS